MKTYAIIENNEVVNLLEIDDNDAPNEEAGTLFFAALGFGEAFDINRAQSPTQGKIGDQFNRELGRFQDSPNIDPGVPLRNVDDNNLELGIEPDPTKEFYYDTDVGRWLVRDVT